MGILQMQGGVTVDGFTAGDYKAPALQPNSTSGFQRFRNSWRQALKNDAWIEYVQSRLPQSLDPVPGFDRRASFSEDAGVFRPFLYDAVTGMGLSMCRASAEDPFFDGKAASRQFRELHFRGASGEVEIDNSTGTRDFETIAFSLWNVRATETTEGGRSIVELVPSKYFGSTGEWNDVPGNAFVYSSGSTEPPTSLPADWFDYNYIGNGGRIVGYALIAITAVSSILSVLWLCCYRHEKIVASSQSLFLLMVSGGAVVMVSTIVPLGMEEPLVASVEGLDMACMAAPWLYFIGASITLSALFAKIRGIYKVSIVRGASPISPQRITRFTNRFESQAYLNPELAFIHVSPGDLFSFLSIYFLVNFVVLITWTTKDPLHWVRDIEAQISTDTSYRHIDSVAHCESDDALIYALVLAFINVGLLVLGNWWAYKCRNIETECNESMYAGLSIAAVLQAWAMGVPIAIVVWNSPPAKYYVFVAVVFITAQSILSLVYIPKAIALAKIHKGAAKDENSKKAVNANFLERSSRKTTKPAEPTTEAAVADAALADVRIAVGGDSSQLSNDEFEADHPEETLAHVAAEGTCVQAMPELRTNNVLSSSDNSELQERTNDPHTETVKILVSTDFPAVNESRAAASRKGDAASAKKFGFRATLERVSQIRRESLFGGAIRSQDLSSDISGIRVLHNPRVSF